LPPPSRGPRAYAMSRTVVAPSGSRRTRKVIPSATEEVHLGEAHASLILGSKSRVTSSRPSLLFYHLRSFLPLAQTATSPEPYMSSEIGADRPFNGRVFAILVGVADRDDLERVAPTPELVDPEWSNPDASLPYGFIPEHLRAAMQDFVVIEGGCRSWRTGERSASRKRSSACGGLACPRRRSRGRWGWTGVGWRP
jgi:hypothetical protein